MASETRASQYVPIHPRRYERKYKLSISRYSLSTGLSQFSFKSSIMGLLAVIILCTFLTLQAHYTISQGIKENSVIRQSTFLSQRHRSYIPQTTSAISSNGTSLVAVCRNNHEILQSTFVSWINVANIDEIILIDWSSSPPLQYVVEELDIPQTSRPIITVVTMRNETAWIPSRAYNIAFRLASTSTIIRIDCDHWMRPDFLERHILKADSFFTGREELARTKDELNLRNILYLFRGALLSVGGYDERIQEFGGEHENLVHRLLKADLLRKDLDYNGFEYIAHQGSDVLRITNEGFGAPIEASSQYFADLETVEMNVNFKIVDSLPSWDSTMGSASFQHDKDRNITVPSFRHTGVKYVMFNISQKAQDLRSNITNSSLASHTAEAIGDILSTQYYVPRCLVSPLKLNDQKVILKAFSYARDEQRISSPKALIVFLTGELSSRLTLLGSALSFAFQTQRIVISYWFPLTGVDKEMTSFSSLFTEQNALTVIEDLPEKVTSFPRRCLNFKTVPKTEYFEFRRAQKVQPLVNAQDSMHHIAVEGDTRIHSNVLHLSNDKMVQSQILDLEISPDISSRLRTLEDLHISRAVGIYVPPSNRESANNSNLMESFSKLHMYLTSIRKGAARTEVYADTDELFRSRLRSLDIFLLPQISFTLDIERGNETGACFKCDLARSLALTRTSSFYSTTENEFSQFVRVLRGDNYR